MTATRRGLAARLGRSLGNGATSVLALLPAVVEKAFALVDAVLDVVELVILKVTDALRVVREKLRDLQAFLEDAFAG